MHKLGDQWIEIIDGKEHMVKASRLVQVSRLDVSIDAGMLILAKG